MLHILIGEAAALSNLKRDARLHRDVIWIVPKSANPGEPVVLFFPHCGFVANGVVRSQPVLTQFGRKAAYEATIGQLALFRTAIPISALAEMFEKFPLWRWPRYPRSYTTVRDSLARMLTAFLLRMAQRRPTNNLHWKALPERPEFSGVRGAVGFETRLSDERRLSVKPA